MAHYTGMAGKKSYTLGTQLASGGEGVVYEIAGDKDHVAKIYKPNRFNNEAERNTMERKLKAMLSMNVSAVVDGLLRLAWPQDILYENGKIVGFTMPRVNAKYKIFDVYRTGKSPLREIEYPDFTWKYSAQFAYNMAWVVNYLHRNNIVIGDLNQNNIAVDTKTGAVILIDCDSFDIRDPRSGEHFPCVVGLEEMLAPELQTVGSLRNGNFTKESDNFSLAIHIFRMLMNNEDPFGGAITTNASSSACSANKAIINGACPYVRNDTGKKLLPRMPKLEILPKNIQDLFQKTFNYTAITAKAKISNRATAEEWVNALAILSAPEPNRNLRTCSANRKHVYPVHNATCPWCAIEQAIANSQQPKPPQPKPTSLPTHYNPGNNTNKNNNNTNTNKNNTTNIYVPPVRRTATLFYIVLILFGIASGFVFGPLVSGLVTDFFGVYMSETTANVILSIIGLIGGAILAHSLEDKYTRANNGFVWLLMGFVSLLIPLAVAFALGLVAAIVMLVLYVAFTILAFVIGISCLCGMCSGG